MKTMIFSAAICLLILLNAVPASAQAARFIGQWENVDANTRGNSGIEITREGDQVAVQIYGACTPTPCVWKKTAAALYAPNVDANAVNETVALSLDIDAGFAQKIVILRMMGERLQAQVLTRFTDRSQRADYYQTEVFAAKGAKAATINLENQSPNDQSPNNSGNRGTAAFGTPSDTSGDNTLLIGKTGDLPNAYTGGVLNGKAVTLVKPEYPPAALAVRATGAVNVQVTIDEEGNVVSASAISGHPLLRYNAEKAARLSKFSPNISGGQPVKLVGVIVYNFVP